MSDRDLVADIAEEALAELARLRTALEQLADTWLNRFDSDPRNDQWTCAEELKALLDPEEAPDARCPASREGSRMSDLFLPLVKSPHTDCWYIPVLAKPGSREESERFLTELAEDFAGVGRRLGGTAVFRLTEVAPDADA